MLTDKDLQEIEERVKAASPAPWKSFWRGNTVRSHYVWCPVEQRNVCSSISPKSGNADFITHARQDIPALLAEIRELRQANKRLTANLNQRTYDHYH